jgi:hypothetical protein
MRAKGLTLLVTVLNVTLFLLTQARSKPVQAQGPDRLLRARGLEIVDDQGRVRASISVEPPATVDGRSYPETVLLRLTDPRNGPVVKLQAASDGSALSLSDEGEGGVRVYAKGSRSFVEVRQGDGRVRVVEP